MKIVFMGTPEFAAVCLENLIQSKHEVVAVVSVPDKPAGRGQKLRASAVAQLAQENNIPLLQPEKLKDAVFLEQLKEFNADAFVVVAFRMLPKEVWQIPPKGTFNLHASILPQYRGAAPINWAVINGETESGVTTFLIDEAIDTGNILLVEKVAITPEDNAGTLHDKLLTVGKDLIVETLDGLADGSIQAKPQDSTEVLKAAPKIFKEDCQIDWTEDIEQIHNKIRGLSPYPAAWSYIQKEEDLKTFKIFKGHFEKTQNDVALVHSISFENNQMLIHLADGNYCVEDLQPEGKKRMSVKDFINGIQDKNHWKVK